MKDLSLYNPDVCDGDYCPMDCEHCYKAEEAMGCLDHAEGDEVDGRTD